MYICIFLPLIEGLSPSDPDIDLLAPLASLVSGSYLSFYFSIYLYMCLPLIEGLSPSNQDIDLLAPLASRVSGIYLSTGWSKYNFMIESAA